MSNAIAKKQDAVTAIVSNLESGVSSALPTHMTKEHFMRALQTELRKSAKLRACTRESIGSAVITSAQLGLTLGVNGAAWLIPFGTECTLIIGFQGLVDLCYRSGQVESISADVVCENDEFSYEQGLDPKLKHIPNLRGSRGEAYAVWAAARIKGSSKPVYVVLNKEEVMTVKSSSAGAKKSDSPWNGKFENEMWKKTAIRRLCKLLPKSVELSHALEFENQQEERLKEADYEEVDPLAPGRHENKKPESGITSAPTEGYSRLMNVYRGNEKEVDVALSKEGMDSLDAIDPEMITEGMDSAMISIAEEFERE